MARPKKRVLLIDKDEERLGELRFVLETRGYSVVQHARGVIDVMIAHWPIAHGICKRLKTRHPDAPLIVLAPVAELFPHCVYADIMLWNNLSRVEFLQQVHVSACRKRGPKKGFKELLEQIRQQKGPASHGDGSEMTLEQKQAVRDGAAA